MSSRSSGKSSEGFFTGKGFYIVLFLCAAVIGVSAWMMAAGNETMGKQKTGNSLDNSKVETIIIPADANKRLEPTAKEEVPAVAPEVSNEGPVQDADVIPEDAQVNVWKEGDTIDASTVNMYVWPVTGEIERQFSIETLNYDTTMRDWRTHKGIDILAELGASVSAAHAGTVESVVSDSLFGTVVTVDHGDGTKAVYANLAEVPAVSAGDRVEPGMVIGSVGTTALAEIGQGTHLHFAILANGEYADPLGYLPG